MAATPNIEELKVASGYDNLVTAYKFLFNCEVSEDHGFLFRIEKECRQLRGKIEKREQTIRETLFLGPFNEKAVDGLMGLIEIQCNTPNFVIRSGIQTGCYSTAQQS